VAGNTGYLIIGALIITIALCWYLRLAFALGAIVALVHDATVTIGLFSILNKEVDLTVIAAILTLLGYSMNDTIIVFDRIREERKNKPNFTLPKIINLSINETLSRTILTSGLTFLVVLSLYLFGGTVIHDFAFAMLIGIIVGTYSSIFIASPILLALEPRIEEPGAVGAVR
jgi:preprotein translocase subunit SecF